jgi:hypothetical protein
VLDRRKRCRSLPVGRIANPSLAAWNEDVHTAAKYHRRCDSAKNGLFRFHMGSSQTDWQSVLLSMQLRGEPRTGRLHHQRDG